MGIYSTMFMETDLTSVQDPENPGVDLDQIEKDIAGPQGIEAHAEEIEDAVEGVVGDPLEEMTMIVYESEYNFNQIMRCIGLNEVAAASKGREFIFEAADKQGFFQKVKEAFIAAFKKVTELFKKVLGNIATAVRGDQKFVKMHKQDILAGAQVLTSREKDGKPFKFHIYENLMKTFEYTEVSHDMYGANCRDDLAKLHSDSTNMASFNAEKYNGDAKKAAIKQLIGKYASADGCEASEDFKGYAEKLTKAIYGEKSKEGVRPIDIANSVCSIMEKDSEMKAIKEAYNRIKKSYSDAIAQVNEMEKAEKKVEGAKNSMMICSYYVDLLKTAMNLNKTRYGVYVKALKTRRNQCRSMAAAMNAAAPSKSGKPEPQNASYVGAFAGLQLV